MKRLCKITAVTLVTAFLFILACFPASAAGGGIVEDDYGYWNSSYFVPSPNFPNAESLPYGNDTLVYELYMLMEYNGVDVWYAYRFYLKNDLYSGTGVSAFNGATTCFVGNSSGNFEAFVASPSTVYYENFSFLENSPTTGGDYYSFSELKTAPYYKTKDGKTYNFVVVSGSYTSGMEYDKYSTQIWGNAPVYYGGRDLKSLVQSGLIDDAPSDELPAYNYLWCLTDTIKTYPTSGDLALIQNEKNNENLNNKIDRLESNVITRFEKVNDSINKGFSSVNQAITDAVDDLINAGSDMPTLDTNNDWMNDSLTKVNEWVSQLEAFEQQMNAAQEENSSNMAQAKTFLNGFFEVVPGGVIAALTLFLVMIVVVKVVGR